MLTAAFDWVMGMQIVPHLWALGVAYVLALPIGWDREQKERSAGLRTFPLVAVASCGFVQATAQLTAGSPEASARIIEGLITGMGFIGGGAILRQNNAVLGTATAASLWATGAVGTAVGLRVYDVAIAIALLTFITLRWLSPLKRERFVPPDEDLAPNGAKGVRNGEADQRPLP